MTTTSFLPANPDSLQQLPLLLIVAPLGALAIDHAHMSPQLALVLNDLSGVTFIICWLPFAIFVAATAAALHRAYSLGWVSATVASALLLLLPLGLETRTVIALLCGPVVGIAVHLAALAKIPPG